MTVIEAKIGWRWRVAQKQRDRAWIAFLAATALLWLQLVIGEGFRSYWQWRSHQDKCFVQLDTTTNRLAGTKSETDPTQPWSFVTVTEMRVIRLPWNVEVPEATKARRWVGCP